MMDIQAPTTRYLRPEQLRLHPRNVGGNNFPQDEIDAMADSILACGGLKLPMRIVPSTSPNIWWVEDGNRRLSGAKRIEERGGISPLLWCVEVDDDEMHQTLTMLITTIHQRRKDPVSRAEAYQDLQVKYGLSASEVAGKIGGLKVQQVEADLEWLKLPEPIRTMVKTRTLPGDMRVCRALRSIGDAKAQEKVAAKCASKGLTIPEIVRVATRVAEGIEKKAFSNTGVRS